MNPLEVPFESYPQLVEMYVENVGDEVAPDEEHSKTSNEIMSCSFKHSHPIDWVSFTSKLDNLNYKLKDGNIF